VRIPLTALLCLGLMLINVVCANDLTCATGKGITVTGLQSKYNWNDILRVEIGNCMGRSLLANIAVEDFNNEHWRELQQSLIASAITDSKIVVPEKLEPLKRRSYSVNAKAINGTVPSSEFRLRVDVYGRHGVIRSIFTKPFTIEVRPQSTVPH